MQIVEFQKMKVQLFLRQSYPDQMFRRVNYPIVFGLQMASKDDFVSHRSPVSKNQDIQVGNFEPKQRFFDFILLTKMYMLRKY